MSAILPLGVAGIVSFISAQNVVKGEYREPRQRAYPLTAARAQGTLASGQSFRVELRREEGFSGNRGSSASQLQFQRCFHELSDSRSEPCKITDIPGQQNICSHFQGAMTNQRVIGGCTDDSPRGS